MGSSLEHRLQALEAKHVRPAFDAIVHSIVHPEDRGLEPVRADFYGQALDRQPDETAEAFRARALGIAKQLAPAGQIPRLLLSPPQPSDEAVQRYRLALA